MSRPILSRYYLYSLLQRPAAKDLYKEIALSPIAQESFDQFPLALDLQAPDLQLSSTIFSQTHQNTSLLQPITMSHEEDLIDYSDEELQTNDTAGADTAATNGAAKTDGLAAPAGTADKKGSYVGMNTAGFRDFLLRPELLKAITDCGFEHPSDGQS